MVNSILQPTRLCDSTDGVYPGYASVRRKSGTTSTSRKTSTTSSTSSTTTSRASTTAGKPRPASASRSWATTGRTSPTAPRPPTRLYLDATRGTLSPDNPTAQRTATYDAQQRRGPGAKFTHRFDARTELCGLSRASLPMSTPEHDDMDVFVVIRKLDAAGKPLESFNIPFGDLPVGLTAEDVPPNNIWRYVGPNGRLRASMRRTQGEPGLSEEQRALLGEASMYHPFDQVEKLERDEVVRLEIGLWAGGMIFDEGEYMSFEVKVFLPIRPEFEGLDDRIVNYNRGRHRVHTGGEHPSCLLVWLSG